MQKNYVAVPRPLYPEVKSYIKDLLYRNFIHKSASPYNSVFQFNSIQLPSGLCEEEGQGPPLLHRLSLSQKTITNRHPIPRIQEALDSLGGNTWVLSQGEVYHQGYMSEVSQSLTAFITPWVLYEWTRIPLVL